MQPSPLVPPASGPQQHSRDYLVRVTAEALQSIVFDHYCTLQDGSVLDGPAPGPGCRAGLTEWVGEAGGVKVSLGWDWLALDDGQALPLLQVAPRSNLMVVDGQGYDVAPDALADHLWRAVHGIHWQAFVHQEAGPAFAYLPESPRLLM